MNPVRVRLTFPESLVREPILARLALDHGVMASIRRANVEERSGWIICELTGPAGSLDGAIGWLTEIGVQVDWLGDPVES
jgi:ABC-type methionine transport system ATPase subunit